jgi:hypothetical protein
MQFQRLLNQHGIKVSTYKPFFLIASIQNQAILWNVKRLPQLFVTSYFNLRTFI